MMERESIVHEAHIGRHSVKIIVQEDNGVPICVTVKAGKIGSTLYGVAAVLTELLSLSAANGLLKDACDALHCIQFDPRGPTDNKQVPVALSLADYVSKWLSQRYDLGGDST